MHHGESTEDIYIYCIYLFIVVAPLGKSKYWCSINPQSGIYMRIFTSRKEDVYEATIEKQNRI